VSRGTRERCPESHLTFCLRGYHPLWRLVPKPSARPVLCNSPTGLQSDPTPSLNTVEATLAGLTPLRFGLFRFRSPLLAESRLLSLPGGTEMVHFPPFASTELCIHSGMTRHDPCRVSSFGDPRIKACLQLPEAYRSLPRPSSPLCAKASTVHP
jgi:hypothetical protein